VNLLILGLGVKILKESLIMKANLRPDAFYDLQAVINEAIRNCDPIYQTCLTCIHFIEVKEICKLCNQRPPARIIVYGCKEYDYIPF
jgi:hypothetical protein